MIDIFIIGSKGIPAKYGGYETFVENLTKRQASIEIKYHVACMSKNKNEFEYNNAHCFNICVPSIGQAKAILYDIKAIKYCIKYVKNNNIKNFVIYILTCRIGPFYKNLVTKIHKLNGKVYLNPDGHEWMRAKWSKPIRRYWKISEKLMVKRSDFIICDSLNIEKYIKEEYSKYNPKTTYIAYGADVLKSSLKDNDERLLSWFKKYDIRLNDYYLVVGRFVPENNFEIIVREFMKSNTHKDLVLISNVEKNRLYKFLQSKYNFENDKRIKFVGTIYDKDLLKKIREMSFAYLHGHSVGGTNPSLLEALASTKLNLLFDVCFNRECGMDSAKYFTKESGNLSQLINECDSLSESEINNYDIKSTNEIVKRYSWQYIISEYEKIFLEENL